MLPLCLPEGCCSWSGAGREWRRFWPLASPCRCCGCVGCCCRACCPPSVQAVCGGGRGKRQARQGKGETKAGQDRPPRQHDAGGTGLKEMPGRRRAVASGKPSHLLAAAAKGCSIHLLLLARLQQGGRRVRQPDHSGQ